VLQGPSALVCVTVFSPVRARFGSWPTDDVREGLLYTISAIGTQRRPSALAIGLGAGFFIAWPA
jgi:hypothetical protein